MSLNTLLFIEHKNGVINQESLSLLSLMVHTKGRNSIETLALGTCSEQAGETALRIGASKSHIISDVAFNGNDRELYLRTFEDVVTKVQPYLFIACPSELTMDIFPLLSENLSGAFDDPLIDFNIIDHSGSHYKKVLRIALLQAFRE